MNGNCAEDGCFTAANFPDESGELWCESHYDGDPQFSHVENDLRQAELRELYDF